MNTYIYICIYIYIYDFQKCWTCLTICHSFWTNQPTKIPTFTVFTTGVVQPYLCRFCRRRTLCRWRDNWDTKPKLVDLHIPQSNTYLSEVICWKSVKMMVEIMYHLSCMKPLWNPVFRWNLSPIWTLLAGSSGHPGQFGSNSLRQPSASSWFTAPRTCKNDRFQSMACFSFCLVFFSGWDWYTENSLYSEKNLKAKKIGVGGSWDMFASIHFYF